MERVQFLAVLVTDERDYEFASKYDLPILKVVECEDDQLPYSGDGDIINSPILNALER